MALSPIEHSTSSYCFYSYSQLNTIFHHALVSPALDMLLTTSRLPFPSQKAPVKTLIDLIIDV